MNKAVQYISVCLFLFYNSSEILCQNKQTDSLLLKKTCLSATVKAIQLEINRYQGWIDYAKQQNDSSKQVDYQITLDSLKKDLNKFQQMSADEYVLPQRQKAHSSLFNNDSYPKLLTRKAWVEETAADNTVLFVEGMSKSGPWFHLTGIVGNNYSVLKPNKKYYITLCIVYPRNYWNMISDYVCVISFTE